MCRETVYLSMMYGVPMLCSHHYSLGLEKSSVYNQYNLSFTDNWPEWVFDIVTIEREVPDESPVYIADIKDLAIRNIKRFSGPKRKDDIKAYVDKNFTMGSQFVVGLSIAVFDLISEGIAHFRK
jgi:hypothetical protein